MHKCLLHDSPHKQQGHGHSLKVSQTQKTSTETSHSRTGSPSPSYVISPLRTFFDRCSPLGHVYSQKTFYTHRSLPLPHPSVAQPIRAMLQCTRAGNKRRQRHSRLCCHLGLISRVRPHVCHYYSNSSRFHSAHIFTFEILPRQFYLHDRLRFSSLYFLCVLRILQPRPELQRIIDGCSVAGMKSA